MAEISPAERLNIKESIISYLKGVIPFEDSFNWIISAEDSYTFWDRVDSLPIFMSFEAHKLAATLPINGSSFPSASMDPVIEQFWFAHQKSLGREPCTMNGRMIVNATANIIVEIAKSIPIVNVEDDFSCLHIRNTDFNMENIILACDSYCQGGKPWLFIEIEELRSLYMEIDDILVDADPRYSLFTEQLYTQMKNLEIRSVRQFNNISSNYFSLEHDNEDRDVDSHILDALRELFVGVKEFIDSSTLPPEIRDPTQWEGTIGDALADQMSLNITDRAAYYITPQGIAARMTGEISEAFDDYSLADMMFTNGDGVVMPLGYLESVSDIEAVAPDNFIKASFELMAAEIAKEKGFSQVQEPCIEILRDVVLSEFDQLSVFVKARMKKTNQTADECIKEML